MCNTYLSLNSRKADLEKWEYELAKCVVIDRVDFPWPSH